MNSVIEYFSGTYGMMELAATILLILNVYLLAKQKISNFVFGALGVLLYGYIFLHYKLYSDMLLQWLYYLPTQLLGWYWWKTLGTNGDDSLPVTKLGSKYHGLLLASIVIPSFILGEMMAAWTDAAFPRWDALTTVMSIVANFLLLRKVWENWVIWIVMDAIAINIYYMKGLYVTSGLYVVFLFLATYGLIKWSNDWSKQNG